MSNYEKFQVSTFDYRSLGAIHLTKQTCFFLNFFRPYRNQQVIKETNENGVLDADVSQRHKICRYYGTVR